MTRTAAPSDTPSLKVYFVKRSPILRQNVVYVTLLKSVFSRKNGDLEETPHTVMNLGDEELREDSMKGAMSDSIQAMPRENHSSRQEDPISQPVDRTPAVHNLPVEAASESLNDTKLPPANRMRDSPEIHATEAERKASISANDFVTNRGKSKSVMNDESSISRMSHPGVKLNFTGAKQPPVIISNAGENLSFDEETLNARDSYRSGNSANGNLGTHRSSDEISSFDSFGVKSSTGRLVGFGNALESSIPTKIVPRGSMVGRNNAANARSSSVAFVDRYSSSDSSEVAHNEENSPSFRRPFVMQTQGTPVAECNSTSFPYVTDEEGTRSENGTLKNIGNIIGAFSPKSPKSFSSSGKDQRASYDVDETPYVSAAAAAVTKMKSTTRMEKGARQSMHEVEGKAFAAARRTGAVEQQEHFIAQEMKKTSQIVTLFNLPEDPSSKRRRTKSTSSSDSGTNIDAYDDVPSARGHLFSGIVRAEPAIILPETKSDLAVAMQSDKLYPRRDPRMKIDIPKGVLPNVAAIVDSEGEIKATARIASKTRTVQTVTYKTEKDGLLETRVEQKITLQSDGSAVDHDQAFAKAIHDATSMDPNMAVEKIEIQRNAFR
ncbi:unnamed protein product [Notodromas monacha]|uniref:Band 4.1 C-terminal domain-containing protein n=1 Tax=Notodromas monacha TaxID=399045 RepID=A0A7R9BJ89_9CRUS|nr:unnamed protein product [Notodromas monacha]CAG0915155.1 unnamed protein product [Notodromas monacha]